MRLDEVDDPDPPMQHAEKRIGLMGTDCLHLQRNHLVERPEPELAPSQIRIRALEIVIECDHPTIVGDRLAATVLCAEHLTFDVNERAN